MPPPSRARRAARLASLLPLLGVGLALTPLPVRAHALLQRADPAQDARLPESPKAITLSFTEPPEPALSAIQVLDRTGSEVQKGSATVSSTDPGVLEVQVPELQEGVYTVVWRVVSRVDGHPTGGTFAFGVRASPFLVQTRPMDAHALAPEPSPLEMAGRWGLFVGLGFLLGAAWVGALAFRRPPDAIPRSALIAALVAAVGLTGLALAQRGAAGVSLGDLAATEIGRALLWRTVGLVVAGGFVLMALRRGRWRGPALLGAGIATAAVMFVHVEAGHASAAGTLRWGQVAAQWVHVAAVGIWLGGLGALLLGVRGEPAEAKTAAVRRFSAVAAFALAAVAVTGVVRAVDEVGSWGGLVTSGYGRLVMVKGGLLLGLAALGGVNRYRNVPRAGRSLAGLRRVSRAELALAAGLLAAAAVLATLVPPASVPEVHAAPAAVAVTGSDFATSVRARLEVDPAVPGPNRFRLRLSDYDSGEPIRGAAVELRFEPVAIAGVEESVLRLKSEGDGVYQGVGANLAAGGPWEVTALVQREGGSVEIPLEVATVCETTEIPGPNDLFTIDVVELPDGSSVQGYLLNLGPGRYELHFTFIDPRGREVPVDGSPVFAATGPEGERMLLDPRALSRGHFFAKATVDPGSWRFDGIAVTADGNRQSGCFEEAVER
jgi:copper transport protein